MFMSCRHNRNVLWFRYSISSVQKNSKSLERWSKQDKIGATKVDVLPWLIRNYSRVFDEYMWNLTRPQSSSYSIRQHARWTHLTLRSLFFGIHLSPRCISYMKTTGDESGVEMHTPQLRVSSYYSPVVSNSFVFKSLFRLLRPNTK